MAEEPTSSASEDTGGTTEAENGTSKTYSQEELDRIVAQRVQKSKSQFKDYDQYKQAAQRLEEIESSQRSEAEKLLSAVEKANQKAQEAADREKAATDRANHTLVRAAVVSEASRQKAIDPDAVFALLDHSKLTIGDGDRVEGVEEAVTSLLDERSYLAGRPQSGGFDGGARQTAHVESSRADLNAQIRKAAGFA